MEVIEAVLSDPTRDCINDPCWHWRSRPSSRLIPVMHHDGRTQPVRGLLFRTRNPDLAELRPIRSCADMLCVHPGHCRHIAVVRAEPALTWEEFQQEPASIDEIVSAVYEATEPWDATAIAELYDYQVEQVLDAITRIRAGEF